MSNDITSISSDACTSRPIIESRVTPKPELDKLYSNDLDQCVKNLLSWEMCIMNLNTKAHDLLEANKKLKRQIEMMQSSGVSDRKSIADLQDTVKTLQAILRKRIDQKEELKTLHEQLLNQKEKAIQAENMLEADQKKFKDSLQLQQDKSARDTVKLKQKLSEQYTQNELELNGRIESLSIELSNERENRQEMEKKHENEIVKMQMEYEGKLALMQAHNNRLQSSSTTVNFGNNEVFRKKLQHIQEESSKEIYRLKQEITVLRLKLDTKLQNKDHPSPILPTSGRTGILKRRRF